MTLYELHSKCNPDTESIQTLVLPKVANSLEIIDRACSSEHSNSIVWNALVQLPVVGCSRYHPDCIYYSSPIAWKGKKKSFGLCLCIAQVLIMYGLHLASGSMLQTCFYDREDGLFLLWYLFFSCLEFFDIFSTISVAFFGLLSAWKSWIKGPTKYVQNNSVSQERSFVRIF